MTLDFQPLADQASKNVQGPHLIDDVVPIFSKGSKVFSCSANLAKTSSSKGSQLIKLGKKYARNQKIVCNQHNQLFFNFVRVTNVVSVVGSSNSFVFLVVTTRNGLRPRQTDSNSAAQSHEFESCYSRQLFSLFSFLYHNC